MYQQRPATLAFVVLVLLILGACAPKSERQTTKLTGATMGTQYHISVVSNESIDGTALQSSVDDLLVRINQAMSTYIPDSEINQLNDDATGEWIPVSDELFEVLSVSQQVSELTGGAFDITVRPLIDLWGFGPVDTHDQVPNDEAIAAARQEIGWQSLELNAERQELRMKQRLTLDLSAVAKGYAVDKVAELVESAGFDHYLVEIGGELRLAGHNAKDLPWRIAVERPDSGLQNGVFEALSLTDAAIATSGDYRNFFEKDGVRYSHTIDPTTGYPIRHHLASVTVITDKCGFADALATGFNVLGAERSLELAEEHGVAALFIVKEADGFRELTSQTFAPYLSGQSPSIH